MPKRNVGQTARMVRDLLDVSRVHDGRLRLRPAPVQVDDALAHAAGDFQEVAAKAGVTLEMRPGGPSAVLADSQRLAQVVGNFPSNAIKFTSRGGGVRVSVQAEDAGVRVSAKDEGPGLTQADAAKLFRPFSQTPEGRRKREGSGLGLVISRGVVERHGGTVGVKSLGPRHGSTLWFQIPRASPNLAGGVYAPSHAPSAAA